KAILAIGGLLLLSGAVWALRPSSAEIVHAQRADVVRELIAPAVVETRRDPVALGFGGAGRVAEGLVEGGAHVREWRPLAKLDDQLARARVTAAEAALARVRARRDLAFGGARSAEIRAAEAEAEQAQALARDRDRAKDRTSKLVAAGATSQADADGAR